MLVHGWGGAGDVWDALLPHLGCAACAPTLPGFAGTTPLPGPMEVAALGRWLADGLAGPAILVGHSMGGPVAVEAALAAPDRVRGIIALDSLDDPDFFGGQDAAEIARRRAAFAADLPGATAAMLAAICAPDTGPETRQAMLRAVLRTSEPALLDMRDALFAWRLAERIPLLEVPLRMLHSDALLARAAHVPLAVLRNVPVRGYGPGHFPMVESPERLAPLLFREIADLDQPADPRQVCQSRSATIPGQSVRR